MKSLLFILFVFIVSICNAQETFIKTYDGFENNITTRQILTLPSNEQILLSYDLNYDNDTVGNLLKFLRITKTGEIKIFKSFYTGNSLGSGNIKGIVTKDNDIVIAMSLYDSKTYDYSGVMIIKCNIQGQILWKKHVQSATYSGLIVESIKENEKGEVFLLCETVNKNSPGHGFQIIKILKNGDYSKNINIKINAGHYYVATSLCLTNKGDLIVSGALGGAFNDIGSLVKLNSSSKVLYSKSIVSSIYKYNLNVWPLKVLEQNGKTLLFGKTNDESTDSVFILPVSDVSKTSRAEIGLNTYSNIRSFLRNHQQFLPFELDNLSYFSNLFSFNYKTELTTVENVFGYNGNDYYNIKVERYDSAGRICPDFKTPDAPEKPGKKDFDFNDISYRVIRDSVFIKDDISIYDSTVTKTYTYCEGKASKKEQLKKENQLKLSIFPNPVKTNCQLQFVSEKQQQVIIDVVNLQGQKIKRFNTNAVKGKNNINLNTASIPKGFYLLRINNNFSNQIRFLKE